jgi:hypothetical protein
MLDFVEARLAPGPRGEIEAHVASCGVCAALVATLAEAWHAEGKLGPGAYRLVTFSPCPKIPRVRGGERTPG